MSTTRKPGRRCPRPARTRRCGESPKGFFQFLRRQPQYVHRTFAKWLGQEGLHVRSLERLGTHPVWHGRLKRGQVVPGQEALVVRQAINDVVRRFGVALPMKEIEVVVQADRITTSFVFDNGQPGMLILDDRDEQWLPDLEK